MINPQVFRFTETEKVELDLENGQFVLAEFVTPGVIQTTEIIYLFTQAFLDEEADLDGDEIEEKFEEAKEAMNGMAVEGVSEEEVGRRLYKNLFFRPKNVEIIERLVRDCFNLEARQLKDEVLMAMLTYLISHLVKVTNKIVEKRQISEQAQTDMG